MAGGRISSTLSSGPAVALTKTILTIFNFIFWISGIAVLALGIWAKVELYIYMELSTVYYEEAPYILIGVGAIIVLVGSFGCCCTVKGHSVLLYMYACFLVLVFVVELSAGVTGFVYKNKLETGFKEGLGTALKQYNKDTLKFKAFNGLQENLHCCGENKYQDWFTTPWEVEQRAKNLTMTVPASCCRVEQNKCKHFDLPKDAMNKTLDIYTNGCYDTVTGFMQKNMALIGGVALGISFFQLLGAVLACCLAKNINKSKYEQVK
ncbi:tetraspanin-7-like [Ruditapes philippinarum]|uniref:tetraspanin-7-like n=1 Tax=Ruditapes philippinarum TaxID=129788 RepID=UPI00295BC300|nr:tetraspanin-7-like [Ruditapes philippinarum]